MNSEDFFRHPQWAEICQQIKFEISQAQRPATEIILDELELCKMLSISKRTAATLRAERIITYHKLGGKLYYRLSDVLALLEQNKVEAINYNLKNRFI